MTKTSIERIMQREGDRKAYESDAINCGKIKTDVLDLILRISRIMEMVNDPGAKTNLFDLKTGLAACLHDTMNAGLDGIKTTLADIETDDDARYRREARADYLAGVL